MNLLSKSALSLLLAGTLGACQGGTSDTSNTSTETQTISGSVATARYSSDVIGVRVVSGGKTVATSSLDKGRFSLEIPRGADYGLEVVTKSGTHALLTGAVDEEGPLGFDICDPGEDFDLGEIDPVDFEEIDGDDVPYSDDGSDCQVPPDWACPDNEEGCWDEPLPCDGLNADPEFCWEEPLPCEDPAANSEFCYEEPPLPCSEDGANPDDCWEEPLPCNDADANPGDCYEEPPLPCGDEAADPGDCWEEPLPCNEAGADPENCWVECDDPNDPECGGPLPCYDSPDGTAGCGEPEEPPVDCFADGDFQDCWIDECVDGYNDPSCWPEPDDCIMSPDGQIVDCDDDVGSAPDYPFPDFGCEDAGPGEEPVPPTDEEPAE